MKQGKFDWKIELIEDAELKIGTQDDADIVLDLGESICVILKKSADEVRITNKSLSSLVRINSKIISKETHLKNYDFVSIGKFMFYFKDNSIYFGIELLEELTNKAIYINEGINSNYPMFISILIYSYMIIRISEIYADMYIKENKYLIICIVEA